MSDILTLAANGKAENVMQEMRTRSLLSSYYFVKVVLGYGQLVPHLHQVDMELFLDRWAHGCRKQLIEWPRGFFKSTSFTIGTGIWVTLPVTDSDVERAVELAVTKLGKSEEWAVQRLRLHDQDVTQLLAFETIDNARKKLAEVKYHFEENELFRTLFPEIAYTGSEKPWNTDCLKIRRVGYGQRLEEGTFEAIGVGGALQSRHYKIVWEDDLIGMKATKNAGGSVMAEAIRWHGLLHGAFENASQQIRFVVGNRWGYADLNSHIRENEPDFVIHSRAAWELVDGVETAIFPERYPLEALMKIRDAGSMTRYDYSCQYLNDPQMPGEKEVDESKLHTYEVLDGGMAKCSCGACWKPSQMLRYIHYDPYNAKGARSNSCPAIAVIGTTPDKHVVLLDYFIAKGSYDKIYDTIFQFNDRWRPHVFTYEDVGHQNMTEFHIRQMEKTAEHLKVHKKLPRIESINPHGRAKEVRIRDFFFPFIQQHKFAYRKSQVAFTQQLETFPNEVMGHDYDLLDCLTQGTQVWRFPELEEERTANKHREEEYIAKLGQSYTYLEARV